MAAPNEYFVKTAVFKGVSITGLKGFDLGEDGSATDVGTDGSKTIVMTYLNNIAGSVSVDSVDTGLMANASLRVGAAGSLVLVLQKRAEGAGPAGASDKTVTCANAVMLPVTGGVPHEGESTVRFAWRCSDPAGVSSMIWT